ncbi:MAG: hypothetical protein MJE68_24755 [Proteobacteria bacterium]|nr:hypothetical protein [Pseudomonadota bacterium]
MSHTKQHYEGLLKLVRSELVAKHEGEKEAMAGEIRQLEARVAIMLKDQEQQRLSNGGISCHSGGSFDASGRENGRPVSQTSLSERDIQRLRPLIRTAMTNVKQDI